MSTVTKEDDPEVIHVDDVGTNIILVVKESLTGLPRNITGASPVYVLFQRPNQTGFACTGTVISGSIGMFQYQLASGDIDMPGEWYVGAYVRIAPAHWYSSKQPLHVEPNIVTI